MNWLKNLYFNYQEKSKQRILGEISPKIEIIERWRAEFFFKLLIVFIPTILLPFSAGFIMCMIDELYFLGLIDVTSLSLLFYVFYSTKLSLRLRKTIFLTTLYVVGLGILFFVGVGGAGMAYLLGMSIFSALLVNEKAGYLSFFVNSFIILSFVVLTTFPFYSESVVFKNSMGSVLAVGLNFLLINGLLVYSIASLITSLQISQAKEQKYLLKLEKETKAHKRARLRAEESDLLKSRFLSNMSQEVHTPMYRILNFTESLESPDLQEKDKMDFIREIKLTSKRMLYMVGDIISVSKIETGQLQVNTSSFSVNELIREIYFENKIAVENKNISFSMHVDVNEDECCVIKTDREKLKEIMGKLLDNAIKFTKQGEITIAYEMKEDDLEFYVKDTGVGIPLDLQKDIFKNFRQAESRDTKEYEGSGLGLGIAKAYVEELGGGIGLSSSLDRGSVFYFSIPQNN